MFYGLFMPGRESAYSRSNEVKSRVPPHILTLNCMSSPLHVTAGIDA